MNRKVLFWSSSSVVFHASWTDFGWHPMRTRQGHLGLGLLLVAMANRSLARTRRPFPFCPPTRRRPRAWTCVARTRPRTWISRACPSCHPTRRRPRTRMTLAWAAAACREKAVRPDATYAWFSSEDKNGEDSCWRTVLEKYSSHSQKNPVLLILTVIKNVDPHCSGEKGWDGAAVVPTVLSSSLFVSI